MVVKKKKIFLCSYVFLISIQAELILLEGMDVMLSVDSEAVT